MIKIIKSLFNKKKEKTITVEERKRLHDASDIIIRNARLSRENKEYVRKKREALNSIMYKGVGGNVDFSDSFSSSELYNEFDLSPTEDVAVVDKIIRNGARVSQVFLSSVANAGLIQKILAVLSQEPTRNWLTCEQKETLEKISDLYPDAKEKCEKALYYADLYGYCFIWFKSYPKSGVTGNETTEELQKKIEEVKNFYKNRLTDPINYIGFEVLSPNRDDGVDVKVVAKQDRFGGNKKSIDYYSIGEFSHIHKSHIYLFTLEPRINDDFLFENSGLSHSLVQRILPSFIQYKTVLAEAVNSAITRNNKILTQDETACAAKDEFIEEAVRKWMVENQSATPEQILNIRADFTSSYDEALANGLLETQRKTSVFVAPDGTSLTNINGRIDDYVGLLTHFRQEISSDSNVPGSKLYGTQAAGLGAKDEGSQKFWLQTLGARQNALTPILLLHYKLAAIQIGGLQEIKLISWLPMDESTGVDLSVIIENKMKAIQIASEHLTEKEIRETIRQDFDLNFIAAEKENDKKVEEHARKLQELQKMPSGKTGSS